jgi:hypothetical protein
LQETSFPVGRNHLEAKRRVQKIEKIEAFSPAIFSALVVSRRRLNVNQKLRNNPARGCE